MRAMCLILLLAITVPHLVFAQSEAFQGGIAGEQPRPKPRPIIETGAQAGYPLGVEGPTFSYFRAVTEIGLMFDKLPEGGRADRAFGITVYSAIGYDDFRVGVKPRIRFRLNPKWTADVSAGALLASLESHPAVSSFGFVGGVSFNYSSWLALKSDVNVVKIDERPVFREGRQIGIDEAGYEIGVYAGASLRQRAGVYATITGAAVFLAYAIIYMAETGGT